MQCKQRSRAKQNKTIILKEALLFVLNEPKFVNCLLTPSTDRQMNSQENRS